MSFSRVIVITGTPGVGKTTVSKALADKLGASYVSLTDIVKSEDLTLGIDKERKTLIADLRRLSNRIRYLVHKSTGDVVVEGHYAPWVVPASLASQVFVLRREPSDLKAKLEERGYDAKNVLENTASEALDVCLSDAVKRYGVGRVDEIDMTNIDAKEAVEEILRVLDGRISMSIGKVDWLGKLEEMGRLEEFISNINGL